MDPAQAARQMIDRVSGLMGQRLGARGATLAERVESRARVLPARVREAAAVLVGIEGRLASPRLARQVDLAEARQAQDICLRYLRRAGRGVRWGDFARNLLARLVLAVLVLGGLALFLRLRGLI
ncbi:hypothetical protein [Paenirhodobacter enshiensis]|uniref:Uncharacterized protein n=1 Tax=Paenirhodobacter enshiensis TaxID=1105367 RepID=A0A086XZU8_9RHOB|nr:hypothetical protein [Paenirhodobacter enshiensis]KFI27548.1 hypothetical protein CG50_16220 [Paenirhodobacter enshiensis]